MAGAHNVPLEALAEQVANDATAWFRTAAVRDERGWTVRLLEVITGDPPPKWRPCRWEYPDVLFIALRQKGAKVAAWLRSRRATIRPYRLSFEELAETASWDRRESHWRGGVHEPLPWPSEVWRISRSTNIASPHGELIGSESPSFASFDVAASCLLGVDLTGWNISGSEFVVRRQDDRGRLASIHVHPTEVRAYVDGRQLRGSVVELAGNQPGPTVELKRNAPRTVRFPLNDGLAEGAWIVLRQGDEWLDRRFLSWPYRLPDQGGVEFVVEPATRLEVLVASGEGPTVEYKELLPTEDDGSKRNVMKTVAAFANGEGGSIVFGVTDERAVVGLSLDDSSPAACDRLSGLVRAWVEPLPEFAIDVVAVPERDGRRVIVLTVDSGDRRPYAAGTQPTNYIYYLRRGANSYPVGPGEVAALAQGRASARDDPAWIFASQRRV